MYLVHDFINQYNIYKTRAVAFATVRISYKRNHITIIVNRRHQNNDNSKMY